MKRFPDNLDNFPAQLRLTLLSYEEIHEGNAGECLLDEGGFAMHRRPVMTVIWASCAESASIFRSAAISCPLS